MAFSPGSQGPNRAVLAGRYREGVETVVVHGVEMADAVDVFVRHTLIVDGLPEHLRRLRPRRV